MYNFLVKGLTFFEGLLHTASRVGNDQVGLETVGMMFVPIVM